MRRPPNRYQYVIVFLETLDQVELKAFGPTGEHQGKQMKRQKQLRHGVQVYWHLTYRFPFPQPRSGLSVV